jgi:zinc protease
LAQQIKYLELKNGLKVLLYKDTSRPKVLIQMAYNVGSSIERSYEKGLAHLVEHMIFKGTNKLAEGDIDAIARKYGANFNAFTSHDVTSYYFEVNKANWICFLEILADCMTNSRFEEQHLASELKAVVAELNMYRDDLDSKIAEKALELSFAQNHPYHFPIIGFKEELATMHAKELHDFYNRCYHPNKAALFIIGDIDFTEAASAATELFEPIPNATDVVSPSFPPSLLEPSSINVKIFEEIEQEKLCFFWKIPGQDTVSTALVDVLTELLAGGQNSRIYRKLVDETQVARDVSIQADLMHRAGVMLLFVLPSSSNTSEIERLLLEELGKILETGFSEEEITRVKAGLAPSFIRKTENWHGLASDWINEIFLGGNPARIFDYLMELEAVSKSTLQNFVKKHFLPSCLNCISLLTLPKTLRELWANNRELAKKQQDSILSNHIRTTALEEPRYVHELPKATIPTCHFPAVKNTITKTGIELLSYAKTTYPLSYFRLNFKNSFILSKDKEGLLVELMMQMLLENSVRHSKYEHLAFLENLGANFSLDSDGISLSCLGSSLSEALARILEIFCEPKFEEKALEKQKEIMLAEILERADDPQKVGIQTFYMLCYPNTGFCWSHADAMSFVKSITIEDLWACHKKYCHPGAFFAAISGLFDENKVTQELDAAFALKPATNLTMTPVKGTISPTTLHIDMLRDQVILLMAKPSTLSLHDKDYLPLSILNIILFYSLGSRLYKIREQTGLFYSIFGGFALDASSIGSFDYICTLLNPGDVAHAQDEIIKELLNVKEFGITESELDDAKQIYLNGRINLLSDTPSVTQLLVSLKLFGLNFDYYKELLNRLQNLSAADVNEVAKRYIEPKNFLTITVGNTGKQNLNIPS